MWLLSAWNVASGLKRIFLFFFYFHDFQFPWLHEAGDYVGGHRSNLSWFLIQHQHLLAMLLVSAPSFTPAQLRICVNTTLTLHPWWVLRLLLSRCLVKEQQEKLNESNKHDSCWRHNFGITTKAGGKRRYSLITFSSLISVSNENKCHLPSCHQPPQERVRKGQEESKQQFCYQIYQLWRNLSHGYSGAN